MRAQGKRLPSAEQMEALRAKFAKDKPKKEPSANRASQIHRRICNDPKES